MDDLAYTTLIEPRELALLGGSGIEVAVLDCRHDLALPEWGAGAYAEGHIPGSIHVHLDRDLSGPVTPSSGRHPLPDPRALCATLARLGIGRGTQVVVHDQAHGAFAARAWWLLRHLGHERVALLNGGLAAWQAAGLALTRAATPPRPSVQFERAPALAASVSTSEVAAALGCDIVLIDARSADRFAGRNETLDPVAGHIPGARNHPFTRNVSNDRFLAADALRRSWTETLAGAAPQRVVAMCGSGVTACHNLLALQRAGLPGARLYVGSWSEWIRDPSRPVERG